MRILGITIPDEKKLPFALQVLFGVGHARALDILMRANVSPVKKPKELGADEENAIRKAIEFFKIEGDLLPPCESVRVYTSYRAGIREHFMKAVAEGGFVKLIPIEDYESRTTA